MWTARLIPLLRHSRWLVRAWIAVALLSAASLVSTCIGGLVDAPGDGPRPAAVGGAAASDSGVMGAEDFRRMYEGPIAEVIAADSFWP